MVFWLKAFCIDSLFIFCIVYGGFFGAQWAMNIALFLAWFLSIIAIVACFILSNDDLKKLSKKPKGFRYYDIATDIFFVLSMVALGHFVTASLMATAYLLSKSKVYKVQGEHQPTEPTEG